MLLLCYYYNRGDKMSVSIRRKKLKNNKSGRTFSLYLDIYHKGGRREYEFLDLYLMKNDKIFNSEIMDFAKQIRSKREIEIISGKYNLIPKFKQKASFIKYFEKITTKKNDDVWRCTLKHLKDFSKGRDVSFEILDKKWVEDFRDYLVSKVSNNSGYVYFSKVIASLNLAVKDRILLTNPTDEIEKIDNKKDSVRFSYLSIEEIQTLIKIKCKNEDIKKAFIFSCFTGLRISDLKNLTWDQIIQKNGKYEIEYQQKKTGTHESLPLSDVAEKILLSKSKNIINFSNEKIFKIPTPRWANEILDHWGKAAGINKKIRFHTARRTFAMMQMNLKGVKEKTVQKLMGHKNFSTTEIYAKILDKTKRDAVDLMPKIDISNL